MTAPTVTDTERIGLSPQSAASLVDMSVSYIRNEIKRDRLPAHRIGTAVRVYRDDLVDWFRSHPAV